MGRLTAWEGRDADGPRAVMLDRDSPFCEAFQAILRKLARYEDEEERHELGQSDFARQGKAQAVPGQQGD